MLLVERLESALDVYNIEVHGEHVFRVTADGVLVHNACAPLRANMIAEHGAEYMAGKQAAHIIPTNGWSWANRDLHSVIAKVKEAGLIDDVANGFAATAGHNGTHTRAYVNQVIDTMRGLNTREELLGGIGKLRSMIDEGVFQ